MGSAAPAACRASSMNCRGTRAAEGATGGGPTSAAAGASTHVTSAGGTASRSSARATACQASKLGVMVTVRIGSIVPATTGAGCADGGAPRPRGRRARRRRSRRRGRSIARRSARRHPGNIRGTRSPRPTAPPRPTLYARNRAYGMRDDPATKGISARKNATKRAKRTVFPPWRRNSSSRRWSRCRRKPEALAVAQEPGTTQAPAELVPDAVAQDRPGRGDPDRLRAGPGSLPTPARRRSSRRCRPGRTGRRTPRTPGLSHGR